MKEFGLITSEDYFQHYILAAQELCAKVLAFEKMEVRPYFPEEFEMIEERFMSWPTEKQKAKLNSFLSYKSHCEDLWREGKSILDKRESLKKFFKTQRLKINDFETVVNLIEADTFIEIYDPQFMQVYRSLDFFNHTSHSLMALETFEWFELYQRSMEISAKVLAVAQQVFLGITNMPIYNPVEEHVVQELETDKPASHRIQSLVYAATLGEKDEFLGGLHICRIHESKSLRFQVLSPKSVG